MYDARERKHLAQADRHIAEAKEHIVRQKKRITKLERGRREAHLAVSMLDALEHSLCAFEQHREVILMRLRNG